MEERKNEQMNKWMNEWINADLKSYSFDMSDKSRLPMTKKINKFILFFSHHVILRQDDTTFFNCTTNSCITNYHIRSIIVDQLL